MLSCCRLGLLVLLGVHAFGFAAEVKDPDKVLRRLQYNYTSDEVKQLKTQSPSDFMNQRIEQARQDLLARAAKPQPTVVQLMERDYEDLQGVQRLSPDEAAAIRKKNREWQNDEHDKAIEDSLEFYQSNPNGLAPRWLWFWANHFSVFGNKGHVRIFLHSYETQAIGAHVFGTFPELLRAAVLHPAMLVYLDNQNNQKSRINENLAREVLELHTLGEGQGYTQADVQALAKALTGYTYVKINQRGSDHFCRRAGCVPLGNTGAVFEPKLHDASDKFFMGKLYTGREDGGELLDMLNDIAMNPSTAKKVSTKLARYFIGDEFPEMLVARMQKVYLNTGGDLKQVLQTLLSHPAFLQAQHRWVSDPFSHWIGQARLFRQLGLTVQPRRLQGLLRQTGAPHYGRVSPDGYPLGSSAWDSASTLSLRLEAAGPLGADLAKSLGKDGPAMQVARVSVQTALLPQLGPNSQQALMPYQDNLGRWLSVYFLSPEVVYF